MVDYLDTNWNAVGPEPWTFEMPQQGSLMQYNPSLTGQGLQDLLDLGNIGSAAANNWQMPQTQLGPSPGDRNALFSGITDLQGNRGGNPALAAMGTERGQGGPSWWKAGGSGALDLMKKNPAAMLALLGAGGAGIAAGIQGSDRAKLPGEVKDLVSRASAPAKPDPYAAAELDRTMRRDIGPGWETSTPGIQAKEYAAHLRQQGDRGAAAQALGPVSNLYANQEAAKQKQQQSLISLAALLGTMGLGSIGRSGLF